MSKEALSNMLDAMKAQFNGEVVRYAAYPEPERKHKRPRPINLREESYQSYLRELQG